MGLVSVTVRNAAATLGIKVGAGEARIASNPVASIRIRNRVLALRGVNNQAYSNELPLASCSLVGNISFVRLYNINV